MNRDRYKALQLLADHLRTPSKDLSLDAIFNDVKDEDLKWVTEKNSLLFIKTSRRCRL